MLALLRDLRFALRMLAKSPGYAFVAVFTLALAIGANTAIFSAVNRILIQPLPFAEPDRLRLIIETTPGTGPLPASYQNYLDYRAENSTLSALAAFRGGGSMIVSGGGDPERLVVEFYSQNFLPTMGLEPMLGRNFLPEEDAPHGAKAVILSYDFWTRRFAADPEIVGRPLTLDGKEWTVVGVMASTYTSFNDNLDIMAPLGSQADQPDFTDRAMRSALLLYGRLKDGVTQAQLEADLNAVADGLARRYPAEYGQTRTMILDVHAELAGPLRDGLILLMSMVVCVLLIAAANVANLMLERAMRRQKEMSVRAALGAGRWRLIRQLLVESLLLALLGAGLGLLLALWGVDLLTAALPQGMALAVFGPIVIDGTVLTFTLVVLLATGLLFGLVPAVYASRQDLAQAMKDVDNRASSGGRHLRARNLLVIGEVALALMLLVGAALTMRALARLQTVDVGFDPTHVMVGTIAPPETRYESAAQNQAFWSELQRRVAAIPGVESVAARQGSPILGAPHDNFLPVGDTRPVATGMLAVSYLVDVGAIEMLKIPLLAGRTFGPEDTPNAPIKLIIDTAIADAYFPGQDPVGQRLRDRLSEQPTIEIIGVVGHVKQYGHNHPEITPYQMYYLYSQVPEKSRVNMLRQMQLLVRTHGAPEDIVPQVRAAVSSLDPELPISGVETYENIISHTLASQRFIITLLGMFAGLALLLAAVGLYAVMSNAVAQRTHELGVRLALGAQPQAVVALVVRHGMTLVAIGLVVGILGALALGRVMETQLSNQISASDPLTFAGVTLILVIVGLTATYLPARRATRIDPVVALRHE